MHANPGIFTKHSKVFAKIDLIAQLIDPCVTLADVCESCRREQPLRQGLFAHSSSRAREQLKQARVAEQIQIGGIDVMGIVEAVAGLSSAGPSVLNTR